MVELTKHNECYSCVSKRNIPGDRHIACATPDVTMTGNAHGIRSGWFFYPVNFDPVWKEKMCKNFSEIKLDKQ
jgi:hypothetical protein